MTYRWHGGKMIAVERAEQVAMTLFPDEYYPSASNRTCQCGMCDDYRATWEIKVREVRHAMLRAFGHDPADVEAQEELAAQPESGDV